MSYINFFPGNTRESRELSINGDAAYGMEDIVGLVYSMIVGSTSSAPADGAKSAIEDESIWADLCAQHGAEAVQGVLEELRDLLCDEA